jgi:hypothetical protein
VRVDFGEHEKQVLKARFLWLWFYSGSFEMPGSDHLRIGGNCFSLEKDLLLFNLNPEQLCYLLTFLLHLTEGKKEQDKVWSASQTFYGFCMALLTCFLFPLYGNKLCTPISAPSIIVGEKMANKFKNKILLSQ